MDISIVICTRNRAEKLEETLSSINHCAISINSNIELIVVDNGSSDRTQEVVEAANFSRISKRYVYERRSGKGYAYNTGLEAARGAVLLFTDDDVRLPIDWIGGMCNPILNGEGDAVEGGVVLAGYLERPWFTDTHRSWLAYRNPKERREPLDMVGANMAFHRRVLDRVPHFDVELGPGALGFGEETLFCWQLRKAGFRMLQRTEVAVTHCPDECRATRKSFCESAVKMGHVSAYTNYHWQHVTPSNIHRSIWRSRYKLVKWRIKRWKAHLFSSHVDQAELWLLHDIHMHKRYLLEQRRPRNYERQGLVKLDHSKFQASRDHTLEAPCSA